MNTKKLNVRGRPPGKATGRSGTVKRSGCKKTAVLELRVPASVAINWGELAAEAGLSRQAWLREKLIDAAKPTRRKRKAPHVAKGDLGGEWRKIDVAMCKEHKERVRKCAHAEGMTMTLWARTVLP